MLREEAKLVARLRTVMTSTVISFKRSRTRSVLSSGATRGRTEVRQISLSVDTGLNRRVARVAPS